MTPALHQILPLSSKPSIFHPRFEFDFFTFQVDRNFSIPFRDISREKLRLAAKYYIKFQ